MDKECIAVLELTKACITGEKTQLEGELNWERLCELLKRGKLYSVVYRTVLQEKERLQLPEKIFDDWKSYTFSIGFRQLRMMSELKHVLWEAENRKIRLISFKGVSIAALYPEAYMRCSSDVDLLVSKEQRAEAERMLIELGYEKIESYSKEHVPVYIINRGARYLQIELHDLLWEDYEGKQADILKEMQLDHPDSLIKLEACGIEITTLGHTEHLVYQIFHIAKHFFFEGISLRYLVDIMLFVKAYKDDIDFNRVRKDIKKLHYEKFFDAIIEICHDFLGMQVSVPGCSVCDEETKKALLSDILEPGKLDDNVKQWETINFLSQYFMRTSLTKVSNFQQRRKQLLPFPSELNSKYIYAKKCPVLLPVAWIHRLIYMYSYIRHCERNHINTLNSVGKAQYRLDLMRTLGITETDKEIQELLCNNGKGMLIVEFCGTPGCGKTTLCDEVEKNLREQGFFVQNLQKRKYPRSISDKIKVVMERFCYTHAPCNRELRKALKVLRPYADADSLIDWPSRLLEACYRVHRAEKCGTQIGLFDEGCVQYLTSVFHGKKVAQEVQSVVDILCKKLYQNRTVIFQCELEDSENYRRLVQRNKPDDRFLGQGEEVALQLLKNKKQNIDIVLRMVEKCSEIPIVCCEEFPTKEKVLFEIKKM